MSAHHDASIAKARRAWIFATRFILLVDRASLDQLHRRLQNERLAL